MKPSHISIAMFVVFLFLAPAVLAQSLDSANQSAASPAQSPSAAEVPRLIKFSGTLLDAQDQPMAGPVGVTFALYSQQTGGAALWMETQNVKPEASGVYSVLLGANSVNGVPAELFASGEARWLEVQVERQTEQPRILLVSVPYALKAKDAETLGGRPASAFLTTETLAGAGSFAGAAAATAPSSASSMPSTTSTALPSSKAQTTPKKAAPTPQPLAPTPCTNVTSDGTATANSVAKFTTACNVQSSAILENGGKVGIGIAPSTSVKLFLVDSQTNFGTAWLQRGVFTSSVTTNGTNHGVAFDLDTTNMSISSGATDLGYRIGLRGLAFAGNNPGFAGTLNQQFGLVAQAGIFAAAGTAKVTNAYGGHFTVFNRVLGTTITNAYGVYISNLDTVGTITNRYDLYASSPNANNFFAGKVGIGTTTPAFKLDVNGTGNFTGSTTSVNTAILGATQSGSTATVFDFTPATVPPVALGGIATATSGTAVGVGGMTSNSSAVGVGALNFASVDGTGLFALSAGSGKGEAVSALESGTSGFTRGIHAIVISAGGVAGLFDNQANGGGGGDLIIGRIGISGAHTNEFRVDSGGDVLVLGNFHSATPGNGIILKSPDGLTCKRLGIDNTGAILLTTVTCPAAP